MKIPRNSPCLYGSGKKFKNCFDVDGAKPPLPKIRKKDHFLSEPVPEAGHIPAFCVRLFKPASPKGAFRGQTDRGMSIDCRTDRNDEKRHRSLEPCFIQEKNTGRT